MTKLPRYIVTVTYDDWEEETHTLEAEDRFDAIERVQQHITRPFREVRQVEVSEA